MDSRDRCTRRSSIGAWPTLDDPLVQFDFVLACAVGLDRRGQGICVVQELAAASVPKGVVTAQVDHPNWFGRITLALSATDE